jgi:hypothetical protein
MIDQVLQAISQDLNAFLRRRFGTQESLVILSPVVNQDGSSISQVQNKIACTLVNVEQEGAALNVSRSGIEKKNPPINLNLLVLFSGHFSAINYEEGLKYLSKVVGFFHGKQIFTHQNTPHLSEGVDKVTLEQVNLDLNEVGALWNALGTNHIPFVLYKLRLIGLGEELILQELPEVTAVRTEPS